MIRCLAFLPILSLALVIACEPMDSGVRDRSQYYYVNLSDYQVKISVSSQTLIQYEILDSIISKGDTIRFNNLEPEGQSGTPLGADVKANITFYSNPQICLLFEGDIMHDSSRNDIRSSASYVPTNQPAVGGLVKYYYTITNQHYQKGIQCN